MLVESYWSYWILREKYLLALKLLNQTSLYGTCIRGIPNIYQCNLKPLKHAHQSIDDESKTSPFDNRDKMDTRAAPQGVTQHQNSGDR